MTRIAIVTGSTRPNRQSRTVAEWALSVAAERTDAEYELVDIAEHDLPLFDEPVPPSFGQYAGEHTRAWAQVVASFDGYLFVTPEYNHAAPPALTNAIDFVYPEWNNKAAGFVGYGSLGGARAVENLRLIAAEIQVATVRTAVALTLADDFKDYVEFAPRPHHADVLNTTLDQLITWARALEGVRAS